MNSNKKIVAGLATLIAISLAGDRLCRRAVSAGDQERCLRIGSAVVKRFPTSFGAWRSIDSEPLSDRAVEMLQCREHTSRLYINDETGEKVSLFLIVGFAGPMLAHTPEICYSSADFEVVDSSAPEVVRDIDGAVDTFDRVKFQSKSVGGGRQIVYYAWRTLAGAWQVPRHPRLSLGGEPMLYKLQLAAAVQEPARRGGAAVERPDACRHFLDDLLPVLDPILASR